LFSEGEDEKTVKKGAVASSPVCVVERERKRERVCVCVTYVGCARVIWQRGATRKRVTRDDDEPAAAAAPREK
jgi:hypothetical protein